VFRLDRRAQRAPAFIALARGRDGVIVQQTIATVKSARPVGPGRSGAAAQMPLPMPGGGGVPRRREQQGLRGPRS
jgi:hypothetical protein